MHRAELQRRELLLRLGALAAAPTLGGLIGCSDGGATAMSPLMGAPASAGATALANPALPTMNADMTDAKPSSPMPAPQPPVTGGMPGGMMPPRPSAPMTAGSAGAGMRVDTPAGGVAGAGGSMNSGMGMVAGPDVKWATGGTAMMQDGMYPDPFGSDTGMCMIYPAQTLGPCYTQGPEVRPDISEGKDGLGTRLSFLILDADCKPVPNASVDIWHAGADGAYSANATGTICNPTRINTREDMFCRGVQMSSEDGRVQFNTIFPGWYRGRTIHIHFTVRIGGREYRTSQLYFEDALSEGILQTGAYVGRGMRDTRNNSDFIFRSGGASPGQVVFETAKRPDGTLHAWKVLKIA